MSDVSARMAAVLAARQTWQPTVDGELRRWTAVQRLLAAVADAVADIDTGGPGPTVVADVAVDIPALQKLATESVAALAAVRARVNRRSINIGVSGRARNGKSTLLQSLSGLGDEQIPSGTGQPVTAVRSRIYHSGSQREAHLSTHTESSFCEEVLAPYHEALGLDPAPRGIDEFARFDYPAAGAALTDRMEDYPVLGPMLARLREMQAGLPSYRPLLTGELIRVELAELRSWVAYPQRNDPAADRRYLAVKDATITCEFPISEVIALGLIDLPGLGELVPNAEAHHVAGLQNDVDFVLVVKRPVDTNALWAKEDGLALGLIGQARGAAAMNDFAAILVNTGGCAEANIHALTDDIRQRLNHGTDDAVYRIVLADAADRAAVRTGVLDVVLRHLAEALPRMDAAVIDHALTTCDGNRRRILAVVADLLTAMRSMVTPTPMELRIARADGMRAELAASLQEWMQQLENRIDDSYEDGEFLDRISAVQQEVREWILDGFGKGVDEWKKDALAAMQVDKGASAFATRALNGIRVQLASRFGVIDDILEARRQDFWASLVTALGPGLASLLDDAVPPVALSRLADRLADASAPCPGLSRSLRDALDIRLDYRTRVLPRLVRALRILQPEPGSGMPGALTSVLPVPRTADGADELFLRITHLAREAAHDVAGILSGEPSLMVTALFAYGEQFEDSFIRSDTSEAEFRRLVENFRDQLWPSETTGPALATARYQRLRGALGAVRESLDGTTVPGAGPASGPTSSPAQERNQS